MPGVGWGEGGNARAKLKRHHHIGNQWNSNSYMAEKKMFKEETRACMQMCVHAYIYIWNTLVVTAI